MANNVFLTLSRFNHGFEENYLTESFVFVLRTLLDRQPELGLLITNRICALRPAHRFTDARSVSVVTQVSGDQGTPDIQVDDGADTLIYIEVKHDSPLGHRQLKRYREQLQSLGKPITNLVLLTRSRGAAFDTELSTSDFDRVCWYEIYNWLHGAETGDDVSRYLMDSFMSFLEEKRMSMHRITWEYIQGVPALVHLADMLEAALAEVLPDNRPRRTGGWNWRGYYILDEYFLGVRYDRPLLLVFENNRGSAGVTYKRDFDLESEHFFALTKDEQYESLISFLKDALECLQGKGIAEAPIKPRQSETHGHRSREFIWEYDAAAERLHIENIAGIEHSFSLGEIQRVLERLNEQFGQESFPLGNNVEKLGNGTEVPGLGTTILQQRPKDVTHAQGSSYLGVVLEESGYFEWNGKKRGIKWRLIHEDLNQESIRAMLQAALLMGRLPAADAR